MQQSREYSVKKYETYIDNHSITRLVLILYNYCLFHESISSTYSKFCDLFLEYCNFSIQILKAQGKTKKTVR
jgi:hypothetical protein